MNFFSLQLQFMDLSSVSFPSKRMLNNLAAWFLEKRKSELDEWLQTILAPPTLQSHPGLQEIIQRFLDQTTYSTSPLPNIAKRVCDMYSFQWTSIEVIVLDKE